MDFANYIQEKRVSGELLEILKTLNPADSTAVALLIQELSPSANTLRGLLQMAQEIAGRDAKSLSEILGDSKLLAVLEHEKISRKDKQKKVRLALEAMRYPEVQHVRQLVAGAQKELLDKFGLRAELPSNLEGDEIVFSVLVREPEELAAWAEKLRQMAGHPALKELFDLLKGRGQ